MAPFYNKITNLISEGGNIRSQRYFLKYVKKEYQVLNIGCGSVQFNIDIVSNCLNVTSIDIAPKMIEIACKKIYEQHLENNVKFICIDIMEFETLEKYDVVFANFFLNTFKWEYCEQVLKYLCNFLKEDGILCIADEYISENKVQRFLQKLFRPFICWIHNIWAGHPIHDVYDYYPLLSDMGYCLVDNKVDKSCIVSSSVYKKRNKL